jgi:hypothetical protein
MENREADVAVSKLAVSRQRTATSQFLVLISAFGPAHFVTSQNLEHISGGTGKNLLLVLVSSTQQRFPREGSGGATFYGGLVLQASNQKLVSH